LKRYLHFFVTNFIFKVEGQHAIFLKIFETIICNIIM
jgi:hypothetical protein